MRYFLVLITLLTTLSDPSDGQIKNEPGSNAGDLVLNLKSISFVKNNEYYSPVIEGYTLLGYFFQPSLLYSPSEKLTVSLGAHFLSYSGTGRFTTVSPVFSARYRISRRSLLTIGTLSGSDKHRLFDPHFNSERLYNRYAEEGLQCLFNNDTFFSDTWISWENFIFKGGTEREIFTAGESFRYVTPDNGSVIQAEIPVQIQFKHFGGQISNYPEHVETYFNLAAGLKVTFEPEGKFPGKTALEYIYFKNNRLAGTDESGISGGNSSWFRLHYYYKWLYAGFSYWKSNNFYAPDGNFIYSSLSDYNTNTIIHSRSILTSTVSVKLTPESFLELFFAIDTYYDTARRRLDNSVAIHLNFNKMIRLATLRN